MDSPTATRHIVWNESNPEWWELNVKVRGERAWPWLVNEWAARTCFTRGCEEDVTYVITTAAGRIGACERHGQWYVSRGDIYPVEEVHRA